MKNRETKVTGGLSIIIEGASEELIAQLTDAVVKKLGASGKATLTDVELRNRDENILAANQRLLDATGGTLSPSTISLLVVIKLQQRLKRVQKAKTEGKYVVSNLSWLSDAAYYDSKGTGAVVDQILIDCGLIRPDVWVIIDEPHGIYARMAKRAGVRVYSPKLKKAALVEAILEHITYTANKKPAEPKPEKTSDQKDKPETVTPTENKQEVYKSSVSQLALLQILETAGEKHVRPHIYEKKGKSYAYYRPKLHDKVLKAYDSLMIKLFDNYSAAIPKLAEYLAQNGTPKDASIEAARSVARGMLPMSSLQQITTDRPVSVQRTDLLELENALPKNKKAEKGELAKLAEEILPPNFDGDTEASVKLVNYNPRNELELAASILFGAGETALSSMRNAVSDLPGEVKQKVFETYIRDTDDNRALRDVTYVWDILSEVDTYEASVATLPIHTTHHQPFSARYGYDIPVIIEEAGVLDIYQQSFDLALELYNLLEAAGHPEEAQYAVLNGHRVRWKLSLNGDELRTFLRGSASHRLDKFKDELGTSVSEVHPLIHQVL